MVVYPETVSGVIEKFNSGLCRIKLGFLMILNWMQALLHKNHSLVEKNGDNHINLKLLCWHKRALGLPWWESTRYAKSAWPFGSWWSNSKLHLNTRRALKVSQPMGTMIFVTLAMNGLAPGVTFVLSKNWWRRPSQEVGWAEVNGWRKTTHLTLIVTSSCLYPSQQDSQALQMIQWMLRERLKLGREMQIKLDGQSVTSTMEVKFKVQALSLLRESPKVQEKKIRIRCSSNW